MNILPSYRTLLAAALLTATGSLWADPIFTLTPSGDLAGPAGSVVGWGFTINNDTPYYLEFSSSQFCLNPVIVSPVLSCTSPVTGVFNDILVGNDPIVDPNSMLTQGFDPLGFTTGLGYFQIDPGAASFSPDVGEIVLIYDGYDAKPNVDPSANQVLFSVPLVAEASVTVAPEPESGGLVVMALALMGLWAHRRTASSLLLYENLNAGDSRSDVAASSR